MVALHAAPYLEMNELPPKGGPGPSLAIVRRPCACMGVVCVVCQRDARHAAGIAGRRIVVHVGCRQRLHSVRIGDGMGSSLALVRCTGCFRSIRIAVAPAALLRDRRIETWG